MQWEQDAMLHLRAAGFRPQPRGTYWLGIDITLFTSSLDCDAPAKAIVDIVSKALSVDDSALGQLTITKHIVQNRNEQRVEVHCRIYSAPDPAASANRPTGTVDHSSRYEGSRRSAKGS